MAKASSAAGFTLIEVAIALAIVAITTLLAASSYRAQLVRSRRVEAVQALLAASAEQEKFHLSHGFYADRLDARPGEEPPGLAVASRTPGGHYRLAIEGASASGYRAIARATGDAARSQCTELWIDESGRHGALDAGGADVTTACW